MSQQTINIGSAPNDGTGDPLRTAFTKCNSNFTELYTAVSPAATVTSFNTRVGAITLSSLDVTNALTYTPLNKAGDTATGLMSFANGWTASNLSTVSKNTGSLGVIPSSVTGTVFRAINVDGTATRIDIDSFVNAGNPTSGISMRGARGTGVVPTAVVQGDLIGSISAHGYGATSFQASSTGLIGFVAEGTALASFTDSSQPTGITFQVTPSSSIAKSEQMHLSGAGVLTVLGTTASTNYTSGTIVSSGGVGVAGALNVGSSAALLNIDANTILPGSLPASDTGTLLRLDNVDGTSAVALLNSYVNAGNPNSKITLRGARGTGASPSALQATDIIGGIGGEGYGTSFLGTATGQINFVADGVFSGTSQPTAISFQVTATSSVAPSEQMRLTSSGALNISGITTISNSTGSTSTSTGALVVSAGGVGVAGNINSGGNIKAAGNYTAKAPVTNATTTYTQLATDNSIIFNSASAVTVTLLTPSTVPGQILYVKSTAAGVVSSSASNVVALGGGAAQAQILSASGKFAMLQSDGTNWIVMMAN
jgi:hypothetical protein